MFVDRVAVHDMCNLRVRVLCDVSVTSPSVARSASLSLLLGYPHWTAVQHSPAHPRNTAASDWLPVSREWTINGWHTHYDAELRYQQITLLSAVKLAQLHGVGL